MNKGEPDMADDPFDDPTMTFAAVDQDLPIPTEPKELVDLVAAEEWDRAVAYFKAEFVELVCNYYRTVWWLYRVIPAEFIDDDPMMVIGREIFGRTFNLSGLVGERLPDDAEELGRLGRTT